MKPLPDRPFVKSPQSPSDGPGQPFYCSASLAVRVISFIGITGVLFSLAGCKRSIKERACGNYISSICLAARAYALDNDGYLPTDLRSMSNDLVTPKILVCPGDHSRQPAANWTVFTAADSSYEIVTPHLREGDTNHVFLRCKIHNNVGYGDGSAFVNGRPHHKY